MVEFDIIELVEIIIIMIYPKFPSDYGRSNYLSWSNFELNGSMDIGYQLFESLEFRFERVNYNPKVIKK